MKLKMKKTVVGVVILILAITLGITGYMNKDKIQQFISLKDTDIIGDIASDIAQSPEPEVDVEFIKEKLENVSSLQTAKITYGCMVDFKEGSVPLITQSAFSMYYEATAYAAVEVSEITCEEVDGKFILTLPQATIQEPNVNPDSMEFYDKKNGLLNKTEIEDVAIVLQYAKKDFYYQPTTYQLLDLADKNAIDVLTNLFLCFLEEDKFEIVSAPRTDSVRICPPISSNDKIEVDYVQLKEMFKEAGFTKITLNPIKDVKIGFFTKDGEVESVTVDDKSSFRKTSVFSPEAEVVITYHTKENK